jgi:ORF6N domain-containing protein
VRVSIQPSRLNTKLATIGKPPMKTYENLVISAPSALSLTLYPMPDKNSPADRLPVPVQLIERRIYVIRGQKVMLDSDLAELYQVTTGNLNLAVRRNSSRFPEDFMFQLTKKEADSLLLQIARAKTGRGGRQTPPYAFTEQGVAMLSSVLNSHPIQACVPERVVVPPERPSEPDVASDQRTAWEVMESVLGGDAAQRYIVLPCAIL